VKTGCVCCLMETESAVKLAVNADDAAQQRTSQNYSSLLSIAERCHLVVTPDVRDGIRITLDIIA